MQTSRDSKSVRWHKKSSILDFVGENGIDSIIFLGVKSVTMLSTREAARKIRQQA